MTEVADVAEVSVDRRLRGLATSNEERSLASDAWRLDAPQPAVLGLRGPDHGLRAHGHLAAACSPAPTRPTPSSPSRASGRAPTRGSGATSRATTSTPGCVYGARASILVGVLCTVGTVLIGGIIGVIVRLPRRLGRLADRRASATCSSRSRCSSARIMFLVSLPDVLQRHLLPIVVKVVLALVILGWPSLARLMRSSVIQVKPNDYVQAARALGASPNRIVRSHVLPELAGPGHRRRHHQPRRLHRRRGDPVLPRDRPAAAGHLVGHRHQRGARRPAHHPAHAVLPQPLPVPGGAGVHHARRRGARRPRPEEPLTRRRNDDHPGHQAPVEDLGQPVHLHRRRTACCSRSTTSTSSSTPATASPRRSTACRSTCTRARPWPSSASPGRASR